MPDVFSKAKRSEVMSLIRGKDNKSTEIQLIMLFREHKIKGWRRHQPLLGKLDFIFPRERRLFLLTVVSGMHALITSECQQVTMNSGKGKSDAHSA
jgi:G:T-mismatch repair DNA endonuclease (very short patch repair protein)